MNDTMKSNFPISYIDKAQKIYEDIINQDIRAYKYFIKSVLMSFEFKNTCELNILKNFLSENEPDYDPKRKKKIFLHVCLNDKGKYIITSEKLTKHYDFSFKEVTNESEIGKREGDILIELIIDSDNSIPDTKKKGIYSIIAAKMLWKTFVENGIFRESQEEIINYSKNDDDDIFKPLLKRYFEEFCVDYMCHNNIERVHNYCDAITLLFFIYLWKSIAVGEFYFISNYKYRIKQIVKKDEILNRRYPAFVFLYPQISSFVRNFVDRIRPQNCAADGFTYYYNTPISSLTNKTIELQSDNVIKTKLLKHLMNLTEQLYAITVIDLSYEGSERSVSTLTKFISSLNFINQEFFDSIISTDVHVISLVLKSFDSNAIKILKCNVDTFFLKSSILTKQIIEQNNIVTIRTPHIPSICKCYRLSDEDVNRVMDVYSVYLKAKDIYEDDPFYSLYYSNLNSEFNERLLEQYRFNSSHVHQSPFVELYNSNIANAIYIRAKYSHLISLICNNNTEEVINEIHKFVVECENDKNYVYESIYTSPSIYIKTITWLHNYIKNHKESPHIYDEIVCFEKLLKYFRRYINLYREKDNYCVPQTYRAYFEYSFCEIHDKSLKKVYLDFSNETEYEHNYEKLDNCFFFASIGYQPFNVKSLEAFFYYYNLEFKTFQSECIEASIKSSENAANSAKLVVNDIKDERARTLQLVGLLGTFIAFVSSVVGMQKVVTDILEFVLFGITFMLGVLVFIVCIYKISRTMQSGNSDEFPDETNKKGANTSINVTIISLICCIIVLLIIRLFFYNPSKCDETITINQVSHQTLISEDSLKQCTNFGYGIIDMK